MNINGTLIKKRRKNLNITQCQLAKQVACTQPVICQIENGSYDHQISLYVVKNICKILLLDIDNVIENESKVASYEINSIPFCAALCIPDEIQKKLDKYEENLEDKEDIKYFQIIHAAVQLSNQNYSASIDELQRLNFNFYEKNEISMQKMVIMGMLSIDYFAMSKFSIAYQYVVETIEITKQMRQSDIEDMQFLILYRELDAICTTLNLKNDSSYLKKISCRAFLRSIVGIESKGIDIKFDKLDQPNGVFEYWKQFLSENNPLSVNDDWTVE
ncbi:helix-turn-helix transcriptional regulator [Apilactobacillus kunkeei]|uniref:helix-turn-helix transcriptional regulator n=1 Tax=Apilactobacillus kunkeei TaxID=148814 RepID=UPI00403330CE